MSMKPDMCPRSLVEANQFVCATIHWFVPREIADVINYDTRIIRAFLINLKSSMPRKA